MARLIYAFLALALGTLVAGFLIRDSSVPLFVSIGLSALVLVMILVGTSRRLRRDAALDEEAAELAELEIIEIEPDAEADDDTFVVIPQRTPRPRRRPRAASAPPDEPEAEERVAEEPVVRSPDDEPTVVVGPPSRRRSRARRGAEPVAPAATIEMPVTEEAPGPTTPEAEAGRPRRRPRPSRAREKDGAPSVTAPPPPGLAPKVWVIPGRSRYHTATCRFAKGDQLREVTETTARRRGYVACSVCQPGQG